jgi:NAD(P)-dependent dehydrogenase (short-subunit alcohol dehydrogenase family)
MTKVAIITGGASGIGKALGEVLAERGVEVVLADRQLAKAKAVASDIEARGMRASGVELDVRDAKAFTALAKDVRAKSGSVDYLFNNAGIGIGGMAESYAQADWDDVLDVNVRGVVHGVQAVYPIMRAQRSGHIVNTASMAGLLPGGNMVGYSMTKHAVVGLSKGLRIEARTHGVRVSVLCPGAIRTPILKGGEYGRHAGKKPTDAQMDAFWERMRPMDPRDLAVQTLAGVEKDEPYIIVPRWWKAIWLLERAAPKLSLALWSRVYAKSRAELERDAGAEERTAERARAQA